MIKVFLFSFFDKFIYFGLLGENYIIETYKNVRVENVNKWKKYSVPDTGIFVKDGSLTNELIVATFFVKFEFCKMQIYMHMRNIIYACK